MSEESASVHKPERLTQKLAKLSRIIESGELESALRTVTMVNPVTHCGRTLSPQGADVVVRVARSARSMPLARLTRRDVASLPGLAPMPLT